MSLSQWGIYADELGEVEQYQLLNSYLRRTRFEARVHAVEIVKALGEAMGKEGSGGAPQYKQVTPEALLGAMGAKIEDG